MAGINNILDTMKKATAKDLETKIKLDAQGLKNAAARFLDATDQLINDHNHILQAEKGTSTLRDIYTKMKESTLVTREAIALQYEFESALNNFLGREILLLYFTKDGEMLYAGQAVAAEIYKLGRKNQDRNKNATGRGGGIKPGVTRQKYLRDNPPKIVEQYKNILETRQNRYGGIKTVVIERWTQNHTPQIDFIKEHKEYQDTFYWIKDASKESIPEKYDWSAKINRGHILETFASLIWQQKDGEEKDLSTNDIESNVKGYWEYMKNHNLNAVSGIEGGDVSFFLDPNIQFAVKANQFNTAAMGPYLTVATQLVFSDTMNITVDMVSDLLQNINKYQESVMTTGLKKLKEAVDPIVKEEMLTK